MRRLYDCVRAASARDLSHTTIIHNSGFSCGASRAGRSQATLIHGLHQLVTLGALYSMLASTTAASREFGSYRGRPGISFCHDTPRRGCTACAPEELRPA